MYLPVFPVVGCIAQEIVVYTFFLIKNNDKLKRQWTKLKL